ncbi:MAG: hypothetical protein ACE10G_12105 [Gemmatimonadales bacterium]
MKNAYQVAIVIMGASLSSAVLMAPVPAMAQVPTSANADDEANIARAIRIAQDFEENARVLTVFDRQGTVVTTVGERAIYQNPVFSPDRTRLAVIKNDLESDTVDVWVLDIATGEAIRLTSNESGDWAQTPAWSPDGSQVAYMNLRGSYFGLYRQAANGEGEEELLYRHPGGPIQLTDWSLDGRYLSFVSTNVSEAAVYALPMTGDGERSPIVVFRSEPWLFGASFSSDGRFLSYTSIESGRWEVYVRAFDPSAGAGARSAAGPWQVSDQGGHAMYSGWHRDGGEIYYVAADGGVMAIEIRTGPTFEFEKPTLLFRLSEAVPVFPSLANVSRDGERIVIAVPHAPTLQQITVLDRQGSVLTEVGEPGRYRNPALSPDGTRVAVQRIQAGNAEIWTFDVDSGAGTALTNDQPFDHFRTPVWSPDSSRVAYNSLRGGGSGIDIKAWNGTGDAEQLFQYTPGAALLVTDWSSDGRFLTFQSGRVGGVLYIVPLNGDEEALEREAMEWLRDEYLVVQARFSPDVRFIAYLSDEIEDEIFQVYVGLFDASEPDGGRGGATPVQVSHAGALGMTSWRPDGRELYYMTPDWEVMVVDVTTTPTFQAGTPRLLFTLPGPLRGDPRQWHNVSPDGERFVFAIDVPVALRAE